MSQEESHNEQVGVISPMKKLIMPRLNNLYSFQVFITMSSTPLLVCVL